VSGTKKGVVAADVDAAGMSSRVGIRPISSNKNDLGIELDRVSRREEKGETVQEQEMRRRGYTWTFGMTIGICIGKCDSTSSWSKMVLGAGTARTI
jgi:hypothetical protein